MEASLAVLAPDVFPLIRCSVPASSGSLTIPASLMAQWPAEVAGKTGWLSLRLNHPRGAGDVFAAPLMEGGWFPGVVNIAFSDDILVGIQ